MNINPTNAIFKELRKLIPTIPPNCQKLVLTLEATKASYHCECVIREEHVAKQTQDTPDDTTTQAVEP